ncbi:MAG: cytochrome c [Steroidobacteraceae bacterium]
MRLQKLFTLVLCCTAHSSIAADYGSYSGEQLFQRFCAACHGSQAKGDGSVASSLTVQVPNLRQLTQRNRGEFPAEKIMKIIDGRTILNPHGSRLMPVWGDEFLRSEAGDPVAERETAAMIRKMVDYLRSIQSPSAGN